MDHFMLRFTRGLALLLLLPASPPKPPSVVHLAPQIQQLTQALMFPSLPLLHTLYLIPTHWRLYSGVPELLQTWQDPYLTHLSSPHKSVLFSPRVSHPSWSFNLRLKPCWILSIPCHPVGDYGPLRTTQPPKYFKLLSDLTNPGKSLMISCPDCLFQCSWRVFFFPPNILTTSLLWSPHPVSHFPHFVSLICWAPNSDHDAFLPECPHALDDCLKGLNPTWFQPVFPASFSRRFFPLCTLQPLKVLGISHGCHAFLCHQLLFFLFLFSPHLPFMTQFMLFFTCYPPLSPYTVSPFLFCVSIALLEYVTSFSL